MACAEVVAGVSRLNSPVVDVGDRVVDFVPPAVKDVAIGLFGTNDKIALLAGIGGLLTIYAAFVGIVAFRHLYRGLAGIALFAIVGSASAVFTRTGVDPTASMATIVGSTVAAGTLTALARQFAGTKSDLVAADPMSYRPNDRRRFMATVGVLGASAGAAAYAGRLLDQRATASLESSRLAQGLPGAAEPLEPAPASISADSAVPFFTPNADFYRIDTALVVPRVERQSWALSISGLVERPETYSFDQLLSEFEIIESDITMTCVSNTVGGNLVGTARWLGVRLDDVLDRAGVGEPADQIVGRSVDGYTCGFPVSTLDGRDAMIAVGMNGEPLPPEHGYPARLVVPGLYGYVSATKWLTEIEVTTFDAFDHYWVPRGYSAEAPIKPQSRIDSPRGLDRIPPGPTAIGGVAWAQTTGIDAVELSIDGGPWLEAQLADELNDSTWRQWTYPWEATSGRHTITVRCQDRTGAIQTEARSEPLPDGATGHHTVVVLVDA